MDKEKENFEKSFGSCELFLNTSNFLDYFHFVNSLYIHSDDFPKIVTL